MNDIVEIIRNSSPEKLDSLMIDALLKVKLKQKYATDINVIHVYESDFTDVFGIVYSRQKLPDEDVMTFTERMHVPVHVKTNGNDIAFEVDKKKLKDEISYWIKHIQLGNDDMYGEQRSLDNAHSKQN